MDFGLEDCKVDFKEKKLCVVQTAFLLCLLLFTLSVGIQEKERKESAARAMVFILDNGFGGNGSVYKIKPDELVIVTTYHLLQNGNAVTVIFPDNISTEGTVTGINIEHDVGFVSVNTENIPYETLEKIAGIRTKDSVYDSLKQGDIMAYCFLSYDGKFVCMENFHGTIGDMNFYVEDFNDYLIYNYCKIKPGMSGCAVVAEDGSYLGMAIGGYDNESAALSIRVIDKVYEELESLGKVNTFKGIRR